MKIYFLSSNKFKIQEVQSILNSTDIDVLRNIENAIGIIGSSNFTHNGLLGNTELNDVEYDHRIVNYIPKTVTI